MEFYIKNNLPTLMRDKGFNMSLLSKKSGISFSTITRIYHQKMFPSEKTIISLCLALDCNIGDIFNVEKKTLIDLKVS